MLATRLGKTRQLHLNYNLCYMFAPFWKGVWSKCGNPKPITIQFGLDMCASCLFFTTRQSKWTFVVSCYRIPLLFAIAGIRGVRHKVVWLFAGLCVHSALAVLKCVLVMSAHGFCSIGFVVFWRASLVVWPQFWRSWQRIHLSIAARRGCRC